MEPLFTPKAARPTDVLALFFTKANRFLVLVLVAVLPFIFLPDMVGPFKTFFALFVVLLCVVIGGFGLLRQGTIPTSVPVILLSWLGIVGAASVSAVLSQDVIFSLRGDILETQTVGFLLLLGVIMTLVYSVGGHKKTAFLLIGIPVITGTLLALHQVLRFFFDASLLDLGVLVNPSDTLMGSFNDLGIYLTVSILIMLITAVQLTVPRRVMAGFFLSLGLSLFVLAVINISFLWIVLGLVSLLLLLFLLTRDRFIATTAPTVVSMWSIAFISTVFLIAAVFFVSGNTLGTAVSNWTGVNYIEVRPSVTATLDVMRSTMAENAFTGIGPNRFADAWLLYKDVSINQTIFWNTAFPTGSSYILTWFVTTGIIGVLAWVVFFALFVYRGLRTLFTVDNKDTAWFFVGTVSFVIACFLWGTLWFFVTGAVILILAAIMTGLYLVADQVLRKQIVVQSPRLFTSSRIGFAMIAGVMMLVVCSVATGYTTARQFVSLVAYANVLDGVAGDNAINQVSTNLARVHALYPNPAFLQDIVVYQAAQLNGLLAIPEPDTDQRQQFNATIETLVSAANETVRMRPYRATSWTTLADTYAILARMNVEGAAPRAAEAYENARALDPTNPYYHLQIGLLRLIADDRAGARATIAEALQLRPNYVEALTVLSQLDIEDGNLDEAIRIAEALVVLERNNPGRLYQLGLLYGAANNRTDAITVLSRAIELNPQFANAKYMRALHYYTDGQVDLAVEELRAVRALDEANSQVDQVIAEMQSGTLQVDFSINPTLVAEPATVSIDDNVVTSSEVPEGGLISPVNTPSETPEPSDTTANDVPAGDEVPQRSDTPPSPDTLE